MNTSRCCRTDPISFQNACTKYRGRRLTNRGGTSKRGHSSGSGQIHRTGRGPAGQVSLKGNTEVNRLSAIVGRRRRLMMTVHSSPLWGRPSAARWSRSPAQARRPVAEPADRGTSCDAAVFHVSAAGRALNRRATRRSGIARPDDRPTDRPACDRAALKSCSHRPIYAHPRRRHPRAPASRPGPTNIYGLFRRRRPPSPRTGLNAADSTAKI